MDPVDVEMEWTDRFGHLVSEPGIDRGVVMREGSSFSLALHLTSITTSHGKRFNCHASIYIPLTSSCLPLAKFIKVAGSVRWSL